MCADIRRIPFTELVERVHKELIRDNSAAEEKYKGRINGVYLYDIPQQIDIRHIRKEGSITTTDDYSTGTITTITGTAVTGASTAWTSANSNNMLFRNTSYNEVYRVTYVGATSLTLDRTWVETDVAAATDTYRLFQDRYALATDFDHMVLDPRSVYYWDGGNKVYLTFRDIDEFEQRQNWQPNDPAYYTIKYVNGSPYIFIDPPDDQARTIYYQYIPAQARLTEYTTGTITTLANAGVAVTGSGTDFDGYVSDTTNYDYYFRLDRDGTGSTSRWYRVTSAGSDTALTLTDAYEGTTISSNQDFTITVASRLPSALDIALLYGAAITSSSDQSNKIQIQAWTALYTQAFDNFKIQESKLNYGIQSVNTIYSKPGVRR